MRTKMALFAVFALAAAMAADQATLDSGRKVE
jgi:hypothetical protein